MQMPHKKKINKITPVLLYKPTQNYLEEFQDDYYDKPRKCPQCRFSNRKKLTIEEKVFCIVIVNGKFKRITVFALRFQCKDCSKTYYAKAPFYDKLMYGKPIVRLSIVFSSQKPIP